MGFREAKKEIFSFIRALYPLLYITTEDERPIIDAALTIGEKGNVKYQVLTWNQAGGIFNETKGTRYNNVKNPNNPDAPGQGTGDPAFALDLFLNEKQDTILILQDYHLAIQRNPDFIVHLKNAAQEISHPFLTTYALKRSARQNDYKKHIIITSSVKQIPKEVERLTAFIDFPMPNREDIENIVRNALTEIGETHRYTKEDCDRIVNASLGLTETEIFNVFSKIIYDDTDSRLNPQLILGEKVQVIKKDGTLEYTPATNGLSDVGGLKNVIEWSKKRKLAFNEDIRKARNLSYPKGVLLTGIQGCGKSYVGKAIANDFEMPFLKMDIGSLMDKWVGASEQNLRRAIKVAESLAPVVLWIDEIDKVIPDPKSANTHEVTKRLFSTLLTWMQEKKSPVFVIATANNIDHLPPELMRKGRFDEIFFVDLPDAPSRYDILAIHLRKNGFNPEYFNLPLLAEKTDGYSGAEIEALIQESNFLSASLNQDMQTEHILQEASKTSPISVTMGDKIEAIRKWCRDNKLRPAN